jgi:hypothetical protein
MNGTPLKRGWFGKSVNCFTTTAISVLESGDGVWMKLISSPTKLYNSEFWYNSFSGTIINS